MISQTKLEFSLKEDKNQRLKKKVISVNRNDPLFPSLVKAAEIQKLQNLRRWVKYCFLPVLFSLFCLLSFTLSNELSVKDSDSQNDFFLFSNCSNSLGAFLLALFVCYGSSFWFTNVSNHEDILSSVCFVRGYKAEDYETVRKIFLEGFQREYTPEKWQQDWNDNIGAASYVKEHLQTTMKNIEDTYMKKENSFFFVAEAVFSGEIAGMITVTQKNTETLEFNRLQVVPKFRRNKIATALLWRIEQFAKERDFKKIYFNTISRLQGAQNLYIKLGYKVFNEFDLPGEHVLEYSKAVTSK